MPRMSPWVGVTGVYTPVCLPGCVLQVYIYPSMPPWVGVAGVYIPHYASLGESERGNHARKRASLGMKERESCPKESLPGYGREGIMPEGEPPGYGRKEGYTYMPPGTMGRYPHQVYMPTSPSRVHSALSPSVLRCTGVLLWDGLTTLERAVV